MKNTLLILALLFFTLTHKTFAQEITPSSTITPSPTPTPTQIFVKYDLAYPGLLPDSPLYKLKVLRDKLSVTFITNPKKKIEYFELLADKGILASAILIDKGEVDLAAKTALKAENNYTLITEELYQLDKQPDESFFKKIRTASLKHQEVMESIIKRVPKDKQLTFQQVVEFSKRNEKKIEEERKDMWK